MSQSAGAGSPVYFMCSSERKTYWRDRAEGLVRRHYVRLTGRKRPYKPQRHSALGLRSDTTAREYECITCGHVGWSNHMDLKRLEGIS
jgi:hypothetical protein